MPLAGLSCRCSQAVWACAAVLLRQAEALRSESRTGCIVPGVSAALRAESCWRQAGFDAPCWPALLDNSPPARSFGDPLSCLDAVACESLISDLDQASRALPWRLPPRRSSACPRTACVSCCSGGCASRCPIRPGVVAVAGPWMLWVICREGSARVATNVFFAT